ncbi:MAG: HEPN domain-containing protein [Candidatus Competibacter sp.]
MSSHDLFNKYRELLESLKDIINISQGRVIGDTPDFLFSGNVNFFVKSYLISTCTYLEAYLQDVAFDLAKKICERFNSARIPHNFLYWKTTKDLKKKDLKFEEAIFNLSKKEISEEMSANPYKTIELFRFIGVDLLQEKMFLDNKDIVSSIVIKRNNIIHHNNAANDISFNDIIIYIDVLIDYMSSIDQAVKRCTT